MSINTSLVIILALSVVTMSIPGAFVVSDTLIQGGYTQVEQGKLGAVAIENYDIIDFARAKVAESNGPDNLGKVLSVATQVVSGINYKIRFELPGGNEYEVVVYDQSWTKTRQLTSQRLITPTLDDINESP